METFNNLNDQSKRHVNAISARLSLRQPQRNSLEILAHVLDVCPPVKGGDLALQLAKVQARYPTVSGFDREFFSLCFALATGVGKTRLMGAFISFLYTQYHVRNFFVLAPNLTIYNKLITDFSPASPKYVLNGLQEFANTPPLIITGDTYDSGIDVASGKLFGGEATINIFNVAKISSEMRGGKAPRIKRLSEYIGQSYFDYLAGLDDLVMIMDESHRYRASAGLKAINDLKPMIGLELTATPHVESGSEPVRFKNVIYNYPLANAIADGFVKEPAVATREDFNPDNYSEEELEDLKIRDGVLVHENTKVELAIFSKTYGFPLVKPFMLIVAKDTNHADKIVERIKQDDFFDGRYKNKVITVHSNQRGEESDETIAKLLAVENPTEPTEIVVHVDKLKEGWDVTNLYTIVPLRAANSTTLVEQSIGRGLRLPYGKRMGVVAVDRLTIVAHDKFDAIINEVNKPGSMLSSMIRSSVRIGKDVNLVGKKIATASNKAIEQLVGQPLLQIVEEHQFVLETEAQPLFKTPEEQTVVNLTVEMIKKNERKTTDVPNLEALIKPTIQDEIARQVTGIYETTYTSKPAQLEEGSIKPDITAIVKETLTQYSNLNIGIPRIRTKPKGAVQTGFEYFDLDVTAINQQPVDQNILVQHLRTNERNRIYADSVYANEELAEDYIVRNLVDFDDISYEDHVDMLYKLSSQLIAKLRRYLPTEADVLNVVQFNQKQFAGYIYSQMQKHWWQKAEEGYEVHVTKGYQIFTDVFYTIDSTEKPRNVHAPLERGERDKIGGMLFSGFKRCSYPVQKFSSDSERRFACILEKDTDVKKWFKPTRNQFAINYRNHNGAIAMYEPDFIVETDSHKYIIEVKQANTMDDAHVLAKKNAAITWCDHATKYELTHGGKEWKYVLIPDTAILPSVTLKGLVNQYG